VVRACFEGPPRDESRKALAAFGLPTDGVEEAADPVVEVWPEHQVPLLLFRAMSTQWRVGMAGMVGLDYGVLPFVAKQMGVRGKDLRKAFGVLQDMEREALAWLAERRKKS
jgi:hypothetical protein